MTDPRHHRLRQTARLASVLALSVGGLLAAAVPAGASTSTITVAHNKTWGAILETGSGHTVYLFAKDSHDHSACTGACAKAWPPVLVAKGTKPKGVGNLGTIPRGAKAQVTYEGMPLYTFTGDKHSGQVTGNITDKYGKWWAVNPTHPQTPPTRASTSSGTSGSTTAANGY